MTISRWLAALENGENGQNNLQWLIVNFQLLMETAGIIVSG
jgi:hypothetical protein